MTITLRGIEWEIKYRDYGYEYDTNAHEIDWDFVAYSDTDKLLIWMFCKNITVEEVTFIEETIYLDIYDTRWNEDLNDFRS